MYLPHTLSHRPFVRIVRPPVALDDARFVCFRAHRASNAKTACYRLAVTRTRWRCPIPPSATITLQIVLYLNPCLAQCACRPSSSYLVVHLSSRPRLAVMGAFSLTTPSRCDEASVRRGRLLLRGCVWLPTLIGPSLVNYTAPHAQYCPRLDPMHCATPLVIRTATILRGACLLMLSLPDNSLSVLALLV